MSIHVPAREGARHRNRQARGTIAPRCSYASPVFCPRCHRDYPSHYTFCPVDGEATTERPNLDQVRASPTRITDALLNKRYKVRGFIGKGGMARVYLAEDEQTGRAVAVKVLERPWANDENGRRRFLREALAVSRIGHPNIVNIFEAGLREEDQAPYLVMEFLFGEPVGRYLARDGTIPTEIALPALQQAASALAAAHKKGVIHRDVKPDNLFLIGEPGDPYELKVLDFGLSKLQTSDLTAVGSVLGTPAYMAPEQALAETADERSDVYGLGMVMYRAFTGASPFGGDDVTVLAHQVHSPLMRPREIDETIDPRVEQVILTATRKDPKHRYPAMDVFFDDLGKLTAQGARLWAFDVKHDRYEPTTKVGGLVADSLSRMLGS